MTERSDYWDVVKGIGIIFVVIGHSASPISGLLYLFHMPLFFFISGFFYKEEYSLNPFLLIKKRIKSLYIPFIKYELVFLVFHNIFFSLNIYSDNATLNVPIKYYNFNDFFNNVVSTFMFNGTELLLSPLWFLTVLFVVNILFSFISYFCNNKIEFRTIFIVGCFCLGNLLTKKHMGIISNVFIPELFNVSLVAILIFYIGYLYQRNEYRIKFKLQYFISSILLLLLSKFYGTIDMRANLYVDPMFMLSNTILGTYCTFYISKIIHETKVKNILIYIGQRTIPIMALHLLSFKLVSFLQLNILNLPLFMLGNFGQAKNIGMWWIAYSFIGIVIPLICVYIGDKVLKRYSHRSNVEYKITQGKKHSSM